MFNVLNNKTYIIRWVIVTIRSQYLLSLEEFIQLDLYMYIYIIFFNRCVKRVLLCTCLFFLCTFICLQFFIWLNLLSEAVLILNNRQFCLFTLHSRRWKASWIAIEKNCGLARDEFVFLITLPFFPQWKSISDEHTWSIPSLHNFFLIYKALYKYRKEFNLVFYFCLFLYRII